MSEPTPTLELRNVRAGYGSTTVLWGASLSVPPGSVVALLGPNGAGKTTLLRAASGDIRIEKGQIFWKGEDVTERRMTEIAKRGLCHVPEGRGVFPSLTVRENIRLFVRPGELSDALEKAVASFPILGERMQQIAGSLSGGQQQMLAIVRAYISNPSLVLVDEASMGLAPTVVDDLFEFLSGIVRNGSSLLLVEQYIQRALKMADKVYFLAKGRIVFEGLPTELGSDVFERFLGVEVGTS